MAKRPESSVGYSATIPPPQQGTVQSPIFSPPPFPTTTTGPIFPPPPIVQPNQIPSPSIKTPNLPSPANGVRTGSPAPHLSTPPGPPVFSSPLQPAAVPFRTSPATPQPVAYSSASSLPTSSPPQFSNGSVDLHHQSSDATEDWTPATESPNVLFSAHKVKKLISAVVFYPYKSDSNSFHYEPCGYRSFFEVTVCCCLHLAIYSY